MRVNIFSFTYTNYLHYGIIHICRYNASKFIFYNIRLVLDYINKFTTVKYSYINVLIC